MLICCDHPIKAKLLGFSNPWCKNLQHSPVTENRENKEVKIIDPNPNNSYRTKKNFTAFYAEVNPSKGNL